MLSCRTGANAFIDLKILNLDQIYEYNIYVSYEFLSTMFVALEFISTKIFLSLKQNIIIIQDLLPIIISFIQMSKPLKIKQFFLQLLSILEQSASFSKKKITLTYSLYKLLQKVWFLPQPLIFISLTYLLHHMLLSTNNSSLYWHLLITIFLLGHINRIVCCTFISVSLK